MLEQLLTEQEAIDKARKIINSVLGKWWMIAVWCVDEAEKQGELNQLRLAGRTTWKFPPGDFEESVRLLQRQLEGEVKSGKPPVPAPLEMAPFLLDEVDGDEREHEQEEEDENEYHESCEPTMDELLRERWEGEKE